MVVKYTKRGTPYIEEPLTPEEERMYDAFSRPGPVAVVWGQKGPSHGPKPVDGEPGTQPANPQVDPAPPGTPVQPFLGRTTFRDGR